MREAERVCLLLDVDGTLLEIAERPEVVIVPDGLVAILEAVRRRVAGALALVSGRPIAELDRLLAPLRAAAAGVHGAEFRLRPDWPIERRLAAPVLAAARALLAAATLLAGVPVEDKGAALALHWRAAVVPPIVLIERLLAVVEESRGAIEAVAGKAVLELRGAGVDKGRAVTALLAVPPILGRWPLVVGDDRTDLETFRAAEEAGGIALAVRHVPPKGRPSAFAGPAAVRAWLAEVAAGGPFLPGPGDR